MIKIILLLISCALLIACQAHLDIRPSQKQQLSLALLAAKDYNRACPLLSQVARYKKNDAAMWYSLAYCEECLGQFALAKQHYQLALKISPQNPAALNNYGAFLCRRGKFKKGLIYLRAAYNNKYYLHRQQSWKNSVNCQKLFYARAE